MVTQPELSPLRQPVQLAGAGEQPPPVRVTAAEAQRRVSRLVLSEVGNLLYGRTATLVVGEPTCWRVAVWLGMPTVGPVGEAGALDVDAQTGEILHPATARRDWGTW